MATHQRTTGIILQSKDVGEYDRVITAYTQDFGKLRLVAISARKIISKLRGGLEPLCLSELEFIEGRSRLVLTDTVLQDRFAVVREDIERMDKACEVLNAIDRHIQGQQADGKMWELVLRTLSLLNDSNLIPLETVSGFSSRFFALLGYGGIIENYAIE